MRGALLSCSWGTIVYTVCSVSIMQVVQQGGGRFLLKVYYLRLAEIRIFQLIELNINFNFG
jgi:hypothetical protein